MRVEPRLFKPAAIALACCLAVPPRVAGQAPPGARELAPLGSTLTVSAYGFADLTNPGHERAPTGPPAGLRVGDTLYPLLQRMWRGSQAFRRQRAQLDDAGITTSVHV